MDKKKLVEYTEWMLKNIGIIIGKYTRKDLKLIVKTFLKENPHFFDEPDQLDQDFIKLKSGKYKNDDKIPEDNLSKTVNYPLNWYVVQQSQGVPHRCPVCNGSGIVPPGFYYSTSGVSTSNAASETCRQCSGTGIIWSK